MLKREPRTTNGGVDNGSGPMTKRRIESNRVESIPRRIQLFMDDHRGRNDVNEGSWENYKSCKNSNWTSTATPHSSISRPCTPFSINDGKYYKNSPHAIAEDLSLKERGACKRKCVIYRPSALFLRLRASVLSKITLWRQQSKSPQRSRYCCTLYGPSLLKVLLDLASYVLHQRSIPDICSQTFDSSQD